MAVRHHVAAQIMGLAIFGTAAAGTTVPPANPLTGTPLWPVAFAPVSSTYAHLGGPGGYFPEIAASTGVSGKVIIDCLIGESGTLDDCKVTFESPARYGFGEAALQMARRQAMTAGLVDGQLPSVGKRKSLLVDFPKPGRPPCPPGSRKRHC